MEQILTYSIVFLAFVLLIKKLFFKKIEKQGCAGSCNCKKIKK
jgi:hypothetical protein